MGTRLYHVSRLHVSLAFCRRHRNTSNHGRSQGLAGEPPEIPPRGGAQGRESRLRWSAPRRRAAVDSAEGVRAITLRTERFVEADQQAERAVRKAGGDRTNGGIEGEGQRGR